MPASWPSSIVLHLTVAPVAQGLIREMYEPLESGMRSGTARVFDNEIPGGQYSNLFVQVSALAPPPLFLFFS